MGAGGAVGVICLDFRKAFDIVSHDILISKIKEYRLDESTVG